MAAALCVRPGIRSAIVGLPMRNIKWLPRNTVVTFEKQTGHLVYDENGTGSDVSPSQRKMNSLKV